MEMQWAFLWKNGHRLSEGALQKRCYAVKPFFSFVWEEPNTILIVVGMSKEKVIYDQPRWFLMHLYRLRISWTASWDSFWIVVRYFHFAHYLKPCAIRQLLCYLSSRARDPCYSFIKYAIWFHFSELPYWRCS